MAAPLAIFGSLNTIEILVVVAAALMIFGSRLPEVSLRAVAHVMRARRAVSRMWRETGLEDELRRVRREVELNLPRETDFDVRSKTPRPAAPARALRDGTETGTDAEADAGKSDAESDAVDPDSERALDGRAEPTVIRPAEGTVAAGELRPDGWGAPSSSPDDPVQDAAPAPGLHPDEDRREPDGTSDDAR